MGFAGPVGFDAADLLGGGPGGDYLDSSGHTQAFVASRVNGTWHTAIEVPGTAALNRSSSTRVSVPCSGPRGG